MVDLVKSRRDEILAVAHCHRGTRVRVLGSMARGDASPTSDLDLFADVGPRTSAWFPGGLVAELEVLMERHVQVVTERGLDQLLRDRVLQEAVPL
jgi:predicted nucleotidyltransferase